MDALLINCENQDVEPYFRDVCRNYKGRIPLGRLVPTQTIRSHMDWILIRIKMVPVSGPRPAVLAWVIVIGPGGRLTAGGRGAHEVLTREVVAILSSD